MANTDVLQRYSLIIRTLEVKPNQPAKEIVDYLGRVFSERSIAEGKENTGLSLRNLQRDFKAIRNLFGYEIEWNPKENGYHISGRTQDNYGLSRILESYELLSAISQAKGIRHAMQLEKRPSQGTEHFRDILNAIEQRKLLRLTYHKFREEAARQREVKPLLLKEFRFRWYLLGIDTGVDELRIYSLDRIEQLSLINQRFQRDEKTKAALAKMEHSYGITTIEGEPEEVILFFTATQGHYIKSLPLHASQKILSDDTTGLRISLHVYLCPELEMDIMSYGAEVKVEAPASLAALMKEQHREAAMQ